MAGFVYLASSNLDTFTNARTDDMIITTSCNAQNILIGNQSNSASIITITSNRVGIAKSNPGYTLDVAGDINFTSGLFQNGALFQTSRWSSNALGAFIMSNVGVQGVPGSCNALLVYGPGGIGLSNAGYTYIAASNGFLGVGLSNPAFSLDVAGAVNFTTGLYQNGTLFQSSRWTSNANGAFILSNVGIGAEPSAARLHVAGTAGQVKVQLGNDNTTNRGIVMWTTGANEHQFYGLGVNANTFRFQVDSTAARYAWFVATSTTTSTELMRLLGTGELGIGATTPVERLHVTGKAYASGQVLADNNTTSNVPGFSFLQDSNTGIYSAGADTLGVVTGGMERFRVTDTGFVGVGTATPRTRFTLANPHGNSNTGLCLDASDFSTTYAMHIASFVQASGQVGYMFNVQNGAASNTAMVIGFNGNIGMGASNPSERLHVTGKIYSTTQVLNNSNDSATAPSFSFFEDSNTGMFHASNDALGFSTAGTERIRVTDTGLVGVGTSNPTGALHVHGGDLYVSKQTTINNTPGEHGAIVFGSLARNMLTNNSARIMSGYDGTAFDDTGYLAFFTSPDNSNATERVRITAAGNIGIGTTTPAERLNVMGNILLGSNVDSSATYSVASTGQLQIISDAAATGDNTFVGLLLDAGHSNSGRSNFINIATQGKNAILVGHNQFVGIQPNQTTYGFNAPPPQALSVLGTTYVRDNVGIGTTAPSERLHVAGNTLVTGRLSLSNTFNNRRLELWPGSNDHEFLGFGISNNMLRYQVANATDDHAFFRGNGSAASVELMRIRGNGNVGIGTTTPAEALHVAGKAYVSTQVLADSNTTVAAPAFAFLQDSNTGFYSPASDTIGLVTGGVERLRINSTGLVNVPGRLDIVGRSGTTRTWRFSDLDWRSGGQFAGTTNRRYALIATIEGHIGVCRVVANMNSVANSSLVDITITARNLGIRGWARADTTLDENGVVVLHSTATASVTNGGTFRVYVAGRSFNTFNVEITGNYDVTVPDSIVWSDDTAWTNPAGFTLWFDSVVHVPTDSMMHCIRMTSANTPVQSLTVSGAGNMGIGTSNPGERLHVAGKAYVSTQVLADSNTTVAAPAFAFLQDSNTGMYAAGADTLGFVTGGTERVRIASTGNVGINTTTPNLALDVRGMIGLYGTATWDHLYMYHNGEAAVIRAGGAENGLFLQVGSAGAGTYGEASQNYTTAITCLPSGNVGVGTASPAQRLHVAGKIYSTDQFLNNSNDSANAPSYSFFEDSNTGMFHASNDTLGFTTAGTERIRVTDTGNVCIGADIVPVARFDITASFQHPPVAIASAPGYIASASGTFSHPAFNPNFAFDYNPTSIWATVEAAYNSTTGAYQRSPATSTTVSGTAYTGEWLQLQLPSARAVQAMLFLGNGLRRFVIAGSQDTTTWTAVLIRDSGSEPALNRDTNHIITFSNTTAYLYYRLIIREAIGGQVGGGYDVNELRFLEAPPNNRALRVGPATGVDSVIVDLTGNVGIGAVPSAARLHVATIAGQPKFQLSNDATTNRGIVLWEVNANEHQFYGMGVNVNTLRFQIGFTGARYAWFTGASASASTELMRLEGTGNLGIGTTTPSERLHVVGNGLFSGSVTGSNFIGNGAGVSNLNATHITTGTLGVALGGTGATATTGTGSNVLNATPLLVGATLSGNTSNTGLIIGGTMSNIGLSNPTVAGGSMSNVSVAGPLSGLFTVTVASNVGIGMSSPASRLHVVHPTAAHSEPASNVPLTVMRLARPGTQNVAVGMVADFQIGKYETPVGEANTALYLRMAENGAEPDSTPLTIFANCNIGIGTTTPAERLHVAGNTLVTGRLSLSNVLNNRRLELWAGTNDHEFLGFGISTGMLRYQVANANDDHAFFRGNGSAASVELMRIRGNGNVGIGATTPAEALHVAGKIYSTTQVLNNSNDSANAPSYSFFEDSNTGMFHAANDALGFTTAGTERIRVTDTGLVGIGITNPSARLHVAGTAGQTKFQLSNDSSTNRGIVLWEDTANEHQFYGMGINSFTFRFQIAGTAARYAWFTGTSSTASSELMRLEGTGNLGIGTATPSERLHVAGKAYVSTQVLADSNTTVAAPAFAFLQDSNTGFYSPAADALGFVTGGTERVRIDSAGNLGIGTTAPSERLTVAGNAVVNGSLTIMGGTGCNMQGMADAGNLSQTYITFGPNGSGNDFALLRQIGGDNSIQMALDFHDDAGDAGFSIRDLNSAGAPDSSPTTRFIVQRGGNVGVGTATPTELLHVEGKVYSTSQVLNNSNDSASVPSFSFKEDSNTGMFHASNDALGFSTAGTERIRVTDTGNVGIGTSTPTSQLEVNGTFTTCNVTINGNINLNNALIIRGLEITKNNGTMANTTTTSIRGLSNVSAGMNFTVDSNTSAYRFAFIGNTTEVARITGDGNVGIGTTTPGYKLDVNGVARIRTGTANSIMFNNNASGGTTIQAHDAAELGGVYRLMRVVASNIQFAVGTNSDQTIMTLNSDNIGNNRSVQVLGSLLSDSLLVGTTAADTAATRLVIEKSDGTTAATGAYLVIKNQNSALSVNGLLTTAGGVLFSSYRDVRNPSYTAGITYETIGLFGLYTGASMVFRTTDTAGVNFAGEGANALPPERARITAAGNFGIGTTTPSERLHVAGNGFFTGRLSLSNVVNNRRLELWAGPNANDNEFLGFGISNNMLRYQVANAADDHAFFRGSSSTTSVELMRIRGNGNVGIGTTTPSERLHVAGNVNVVGKLHVNNGSTSVAPQYMGSGSLLIGDISKNYGGTNWGTDTACIMLECSDNTEISVHDFGHRVTSLMHYTGGGSTNLITLGRTNNWGTATISIPGNLGIGTTTPSYPLHVAGAGANNISIFAANDIASFSDARMKKDLVHIDDALSKVMSISGYTFTRKDVKPDTPSKRQCGVLAQEVLAVLPEVVGEDPQTGMYNVAYGNITALLIEAIKEMKMSYDTQITALNKRISDLEAKISI